jgi:hypothetical protein
MTEPGYQKQFLSCECGHEWTEQTPTNVPVDAWIGFVRALRCPECSGKKIAFGWKVREEPAELDKTITERVERWNDSYDTGISSKAIASVMRGATASVGASSYPRDPADLGRCLRLLRLIPEWRPRILIMGGLGPVWAEMARRWDELEQSMADEVGIFWEKGKSAPKTYALMRECQDGKK